MVVCAHCAIRRRGKRKEKKGKSKNTNSAAAAAEEPSFMTVSEIKKEIAQKLQIPPGEEEDHEVLEEVATYLVKPLNRKFQVRVTDGQFLGCCSHAVM